ncbi:MGMT family protein [Candidatus Beckwithbacteria bacterium]|nr:MGMT family protein [Candidatus Beckwithbacteria bacterium]
MNGRDRTYQVVSQIPKGKVLTYKMVAHWAGVTNPRLVGNYMHNNEDPVNVPCHRVVNSQGKCAQTYAFGGLKVQQEKLEAEGVVFKKDKIDLGEFLWWPSKEVQKRWEKEFGKDYITSYK